MVPKTTVLGPTCIVDCLTTRTSTCSTTICGFNEAWLKGTNARASAKRTPLSVGHPRIKDEKVQTKTSRPTDRTALRIESWAHAGNSVGKIQVDRLPC